MLYIPTLTVIEEGIFEPDAPSFVASNRIEIRLGTRVGPILPLFDVAVVDGVMMNVVHCGPKVPFRADSAVSAFVPDLSSPRVLFAVPLERGPSMELAQSAEHRLERGGFHKQMVVVGQDTPGNPFLCVRLQGREQSLFAFSHAFRTVADDGCVLEAGRGEMVRPVALAGVRRAVPRMALRLPCGKRGGPLFVGHAAPVVHAKIPRLRI